MHLLPHKSWNPYSQKNIDKVRKDEREHAEKVHEEKKRKLAYVSNYATHVYIYLVSVLSDTDYCLPIFIFLL